MGYRWTTNSAGGTLRLPLVLAAALATAASFTSGTASAQQQPPPQVTCEDLDKLRALFNDAYKDEQEKRYDAALEKFRAVERCKASPSVRYRIASVLEAQGHLREARDIFRAIPASADRSDPKNGPIIQSAEDRAAQLDKRIPKLVLKLSDNAPSDVIVTVDGATVPATPTPKPIELDPGEHVVKASSPTARQPFESRVKLGENGEVTLPVSLEGPEKSGGPETGGGGGKNNTLAYVALAAGGVLVVSGIVMLLVRQGDIHDIEDRCPDLGACASSEKSAVDSDRSQANLFLPLGIGFTALGVAAGGLGAYMLLKPQPSEPSGASPTPAPSGGLRIAPRYVRGGAILGVGSVF